MAAALGFTMTLGCASTRTLSQEWDDEMLTRRVESGLRMSDNTSAYDVDVKVFDGRAVLLGEVEDETSKLTAERIAESIPGVTEVDNELKVLGVESETPFDGDPDTWISTKISTKYAFDGDVKGRNIDVETIDGVVYLTGIVESEMAKERAEGIAMETDDVDGVKNLLEVSGGPYE